MEADKLVTRGARKYERGSEEPFTGKTVGYYSNGEKKAEIEYRNGKQHGKTSVWHKNGQKMGEAEYRDGELISSKRWDENGNPE